MQTNIMTKTKFFKIGAWEDVRCKSLLQCLGVNPRGKVDWNPNNDNNLCTLLGKLLMRDPSVARQHSQPLLLTDVTASEQDKYLFQQSSTLLQFIQMVYT